MRRSVEWRFVLTDRCNLNCCFCMKEYCPTSKPKSQRLHRSEYGALARVGSSVFGINEVTLTGGEPLLREDFGEIARYCSSAGPRVTVVTNGTKLLERADDLCYTDELHVSLHSLKPARWSAITAGNEHDFNAVMRGIDDVRCRYPSMRIKLNVVGDTDNARPESIRSYVDLARIYDLEISVFREGYLEWASLNHVAVAEGVVTAQVWSLLELGARKTTQSVNKTRFVLDGVSICLCDTSTHVPTWDSIWVDPPGFAFVDIMSDRQTVRLESTNEAILGGQIAFLLQRASAENSRRNPLPTSRMASSVASGGRAACER